MYAALAGILATLAALGLSELAAGLLGPVPSLVESVATVVIDRVPAGVKDWAIAVFGTADKAALVVGIVLVVGGLGGAIGLAARSRPGVGTAAFALLGGVGAAAAAVAGGSAAGAILGGTTAFGAAVVTLRLLLRRDPTVGSPRAEVAADAGRRSFLIGAGVVALVAAASAGTGRWLLVQGRRVVAGRDSVVLPTAAQPLPPPPAAASFTESGLSPLVTPNAEFFRIDTAISVPRVDLATWRLRVHGLVDVPYELSFDDLLREHLVERWITISCVSNEVGGPLVGNARWLGVPLSAVLERAGVQMGADQVVGRSVDGFTVGFPTAAAFDGREALVAVGMNGEPLPFDHGFPARLVVAGLYGYVSATKWLSDLELTTWDAFDAYWIPRGWAKEAPVKTQSRIDTPRDGARLTTEPRAIAGVAWAPGLGIVRVEVQVDDANWAEAELAASLDRGAWRQWRLPWTPTAGDHRIRVRATDASGYTQTEEIARPAPDGATGWHTIRVSAA